MIKTGGKRRKMMLLAVDIGNTTIAVGIFSGRDFLHDWRIKTDRERTADEYGIMLLNLFQRSGIKSEEIEAAVLSSVVPPLTPVFQAVSRDLFGIKAMAVGPGLKTGMPILYESPLEVGADRIVAAIAAYDKGGGPCIVVDFGTATTFDAVSERGEYLGGAIAPGIHISAEALYRRTARLPRIEIQKPKKAIGRTTVSSMQSGLYFGYVGLVSNIIAQIRKELGREARVIATGGFGEQIASEIPAIRAYEPHLVLEGLRIVYERNKDE